MIIFFLGIFKRPRSLIINERLCVPTQTRMFVNCKKERRAPAARISIPRAKVPRNFRGLLFDGLETALEEEIKGCRCNYLDLPSEWIITRGHWNVTFNNEGR